MKPKLLIITTFYNEKERLQYTLDNMLLQSSADFVHLIIDDGSLNDDADAIVNEYIKKSRHPVFYEKHHNTGINEVHMRAFKRTAEFGCSHFMWLDCGDALKENAVKCINKIINEEPGLWLHLDGYYVSAENDTMVRMSSKSYLPYLKKENQFLPFCFSISTYGHFVIPFDVYSELNPEFRLVDGFYYDAQVIGALSLNGCPHRFIRTPLSLIQDDMHFSVSNSSADSYQSNLLKLADYVVSDTMKRECIANISSGMYQISVSQFLNIKSYFANRKKLVELKDFYKKNGIKIRDRYKWSVLLLVSLFYCC